MGTNAGNFLDDVLNESKALLLESALNNEVVVQRDSASVNLAETSLVDQLRDGASGGVAESNVRLDSAEKGFSGLVSSDEDGVVDLSQSQKLKDLSLLGGNGVDTLSSDHEEQLGFGRNVDLAGSLGSTDLLDDISFSLGVSVVVGLTSLEPVGLQGVNVLLAVSSGLLKLDFPLAVSLLLLLEGLGNRSPKVKP